MKIGAYEVKKPMVIGHESAGVIEEVGAAVKHLVVGDRVALEPGVPCWKCSYCKQGLYNLCPDMEFFATPPVHGSLADQVTSLPQKFLINASLSTIRIVSLSHCLIGLSERVPTHDPLPQFFHQPKIACRTGGS